jgi:hypothetical protein
MAAGRTVPSEAEVVAGWAVRHGIEMLKEWVLSDAENLITRGWTARL